MTAGNEDALGTPIAIINKPDVEGRVGWNWFATQAEADGSMIGAYKFPHFVTQSIQGGVEYSAAEFEPIANWGADPTVFVVAADSEFKSMEDVVNYAWENPGKLTFSGEVLGGVNNLSDAFRAQEAGDVKILGVFDLERNEFLPDVPAMMEQGFDIDNASVYFR